MIVILDYGMGNLRSAQKGLEKAGHEAVISEDPDALSEADGIILPGVGAFKDCFLGLESRGLVEPLQSAVTAGIPLLGICVGMQLLFEESDEGEGSPGLGILPGRVVRFSGAAPELKVPHMGWNQLNPVQGRECPILSKADEQPYVYFVHSYFAVPTQEEHIYATTQHGEIFPSVVGTGHVFGLQFHPEKSQAAGIEILKSFGDYVDKPLASTQI